MITLDCHPSVHVTQISLAVTVDLFLFGFSWVCPVLLVKRLSHKRIELPAIHCV